MASIFKQSRRLGRLETALGQDELALLRFQGSDHLNDLFEYRVEALATRDDLDFDALMGTHASVTLDPEGKARQFDGIVTQAKWAGVGETGHRYDLVLRPWFWLAGLRRNQRIFHNKTVIQILEGLLAPYAGLGDPALDVQVAADYPVLEYTVQYRESDLDFARRQMERFGISFHFRHGPGTHTMVLTDQPDTLQTIGIRPFKRTEGHHQADEEHFWEWAPERNITTGAVRLTDWNFKKPPQAMEVDQSGDAAFAQGHIESFDYPGDYLDQGQGKGVADRRVRAERGGDRRNRAMGDVISLSGGMKVTLGGDAVPGRGSSYICLSANHSFTSQAYGSGAASSDGFAFSGSYTLMPETAPMVPPRRTHVPVVQGPQTALVVGEGEIDCDEYGRILVKFHWDLESAHSMRCRVSQNWAGKGWGGMVIPRIGMEVVVEFLEGDPDKPLVTGCVYNGKQDRPYDLPANKTKSVFRSDTHKGSGYNEITFEDEKGREEIFMHAQKDHTVKVLNNQTSNVLANRVESIGQNASLQIGKNAMERVAANKSVSVGGGMGALLAKLGPMIAASGKFFKKGANEGGAGGAAGPLTGVLSGVTEAGGEGASMVQKAGFMQSGGHSAAAGVAQAAAGSLMGQVMNAIMPSTGTMSTTVEKFRQDTVGIAASTQIGFASNTVVGMVMSTSVGKLHKTVVGEDSTLEAKNSIFNRTVKHTLHAKEKFVIAGPGGSITIDNSGITIKAKTLKIKSPSVDFSSGSADQVEALKSDKPFVQECKK